MPTDPNGWFLTSQALSHRETVEALATALPAVFQGEDRNQISSELASHLARAGYALVRLSPGQHERTEDLSPFLSRKED